jgi:hypothetical protein
MRTLIKKPIRKSRTGFWLMILEIRPHPLLVFTLRFPSFFMKRGGLAGMRAEIRSACPVGFRISQSVALPVRTDFLGDAFSHEDSSFFWSEYEKKILSHRRQAGEQR